MLDILIRSGTVVDGGGGEPFTADVGITGSTISAIGRLAEPARRVIDAAGLIVAPGWIDIHTHYDGQASWDPELEPSFGSGVTTALMGNCGVGFAPVRPGMETRLIELMEGVEDIPGTALHIGMTWGWESFAEYLDILESVERTFDIGCLVPHGPLRLWAMGEKVGTDKSASGEDLARMCDELRRAMDRGAFGMSTSRTPMHRTKAGEMTPDFDVDEAELLALANVVADSDGLLQVVPAGIIGEAPAELRRDMNLLERIVDRTRVDCHILMFQNSNDPDFYRAQIAQIDRMNDRARVTAQFGGRGTGSIMGFLGCNPFSHRPSFVEITAQPRECWLSELARPDVRARILAESNIPGTPGAFYESKMEYMYDLGPDCDFEPGPDRNMTAYARAANRAVDETIFDFLLDHSDPPRLYLPVTNYAAGDLEAVRHALPLPNVVLSSSDAGAHVQAVCDGSVHSFMISHWTRDRTRGPKVPIEQVVHWLAAKAARSVGLNDRGVLAPGMKADVNIFSHADLRVLPPRIEYDLPGGASRIMARVSGYRATIVSGVITREFDQATGARPGRLLRRGCS
ncbi:amidohydrolase family protein [Sphingobium sp. V4]|uniref:N-acyl-D-amino-acid deacylase family protein n=1 Tax=Sphingobium sp. V4 TaxID=3038927 RepID=UPI002557E42B|nr:amidohydrolase family protein [Sphingobium sp. V4]WIW89429.1 amidohydrolase family protein [Sphingobium sp. V4]